MKASLPEVVGQTIKRVRIEQSISPAALARYLHRSTAQIEAIEAGQEGVTVFMLYAMAEALNCKPTDLLPPQKNVTLSRNGRGLNPDVERMVGDALVSGDPDECKRWLTNTIADAVLVNIKKGQAARRHKNG